MIAIIGGTGTVGSQVAHQISAAGTKFRMLARSPEKALKADTVEVVKGDTSDAAAIDKLLASATKLFLLIPSVRGSVETANKIIEAAKKAGVKHVVRLSVIGADVKSGLQIGRWHGEIEAALKSSGLAWTMLQPGGFTQNLLASVATIKKDGAFYGATGEAKFCPIDARDIAAVAVKALTSSGHEGKSYILTGQEPLSNAEIATKLSAAIGKPVRYVNLSADQLKQGMLSAGLPEFMASDLATLQGWIAGGGMAKPDPTLAMLIGRTRNFDDFLATNAAAFK